MESVITIERNGRFDKGQVVRTMIFGNDKSAEQFVKNFPSNNVITAKLQPRDS